MLSSVAVVATDGDGDGDGKHDDVRRGRSENELGPVPVVRMLSRLTHSHCAWRQSLQNERCVHHELHGRVCDCFRMVA